MPPEGYRHGVGNGECFRYPHSDLTVNLTSGAPPGHGAASVTSRRADVRARADHDREQHAAGWARAGADQRTASGYTGASARSPSMTRNGNSNGQLARQHPEAGGSARGRHDHLQPGALPQYYGALIPATWAGCSSGNGGHSCRKDRDFSLDPSMNHVIETAPASVTVTST